MNLTVVGTGYVGLVTGACLADVGRTVVCVDSDPEKIKRLRGGELPIFEPGLAEVVQRAVLSGRLRFSSKLSETLGDCDAVLIAVGTPNGKDGAVDTTQVEAVAREIGDHLDHSLVVITKSTVPIGTAQRVRSIIAEQLAGRDRAVEFEVASNPEFLKEGTAVADFMRPDRIVIGAESDRARAVLAQIYRPFVLNGHPLLFMDLASAELAKYAANAMLAVRISFMNLMSRLCEHTGADVVDVRRALATDPRIGSQFLHAGIGYGGSCFPKDVRGLICIGDALNLPMELLVAAEAINDSQRQIPLEWLLSQLGTLHGKRITVWGLAFKPNTDDVRESPAMTIVNALVSTGAEVTVYDPVAMETAAKYITMPCSFATDAYEALDAADALILATEWPEFRSPDACEVAKRMRGRLIFDGRNTLDAQLFREQGFTYQGIGLRCGS